MQLQFSISQVEISTLARRACFARSWIIFKKGVKLSINFNPRNCLTFQKHLPLINFQFYCPWACIGGFINETLGFDWTRSGGTNWPGLPCGLTMLFNGSVSLSDTKCLRRVDRYMLASVILDLFFLIRIKLKDQFKSVSVILDLFFTIRIKLKDQFNQYQSSWLFSSQKG